METRIHDCDGEEPIQEYDNIARSIEMPELVEEDETSRYPGNIEGENDDSDSDTDIEEDSDDSDDSDIQSQNDEQVETWGVKSVCPLNVLSSFHSVGGFPPDLLHDLMEGVIPEDLLSIIRTLSSKGWLSVESYNLALKNLKWSSYESGDKPQSVPQVNKVKKLKGKAVSNWVHMRNWPLIMEKFIVDMTDPILVLGLKLHEITERITATEFFNYEIDLLGEAVMEYLDLRKDARLRFPEFFGRPKPKHHYLRDSFIKYF